MCDAYQTQQQTFYHQIDLHINLFGSIGSGINGLFLQFKFNYFFNRSLLIRQSYKVRVAHIYTMYGFDRKMHFQFI